MESNSRRINKRSHGEAFPAENAKTPEKKSKKQHITVASAVSSATKQFSSLKLAKGDITMKNEANVIDNISE